MKNEEKQDIPQGQKIFDNTLLLFIVSVLISTALYNIWGIIEIINVAAAP
ncbi:MAG: hypothetical protein GY797_32940 [Deltaproteobacteria bacterium]|nr:hypothetical protein [Deltaproteobacteria bacterium]